MRQIAKVREANSRLELADRFAASAPGLASGVTKDPAKFQGELDYMYNRLLELNGGDKAKSNTDLQELVLNQTTIIAQSNPYQAQELLNTFRASYLNPNNTNLGTWGDRTDVSTVSDLILRKQEQYESAKDKTDKETVTNLLNLYKSSGQNYEQIFQELNLLDKSNPGIATAALAEMQEMGPGYLSPYDSERLAKSAKNKAQLDYWKRYGSITDEQYNREATKFADQPDYTELVKESGVKTTVLAAYEKLAGKLTFGQQESFARQADASARFAANVISRRLLGQLQRGEISVFEIENQMQAQAAELAKVLVTQDSTDPLKARYSTDYKKLPTDIRNEFESAKALGDGTNGVDLTQTPPHKTPFVTSAVNSNLISPQQIQRNIDAISNGGQPTADVKMFAKTSGVGVFEFLKQQAARHSIPFDLSTMGDAAKNYQENRKINPRAAEALTNPRITGEQRRMYIQQLERSRARQQIPTLPAKPLSSYKAQVSSVNYEDYIPGRSGQPGVDLYFEDKQFPVVMPGLVKDISYEPGYGHYVVVESTDPETGEQVDVLYGHLATRTHLRKGQQVSEGQLVGIQGGTGNVRSADGTIASIDFLAPAPAGSGSMTPYRNFDRLRRRIVSMFGK
jgi:murein DD-endopeptidase MepM/ murein hydrolase activator NlpD